MARKKRAHFEIFSLSFLDCICCGFGAVILIFVLTTGQALKVRQYFLEHSSKAIVSTENLLRMKQNELEILVDEVAFLEKQESENRELMSTISELDEKINKAETQLQKQKIVFRGKTEEIAVLEKMIKSEQTEQLQPEYLTNFRVDGQRVLILFEASGGMLGYSVNEALSWLAKDIDKRLTAPKWDRVIRSVMTIIRYLPKDSEFQVVAWNESLRAFPVSHSLGKWYAVNDLKLRNKLENDLLKFNAEGGANLEKAFLYASQQRPDNIILLTDGLPTKSDRLQINGEVSESQRIEMFNLALERLIKSTRVNVLLYPMSGDPASTSYFWNLSNSHDGALICPERDWPR